MTATFGIEEKLIVESSCSILRVVGVTMESFLEDGGEWLI